MRVLVDTSAWVDFLNGLPSPAADAVAELLQGDDDVCTCGLVVAEVFQGLRRDQGRDAIRRSFEDMTCLEPPGIHPTFGLRRCIAPCAKEARRSARPSTASLPRLRKPAAATCSRVIATWTRLSRAAS